MRAMVPLSRHPSVFLVCVTALLAGACGDESVVKPITTDTMSADGTPTPGGSLKIGVLVPQSGPLAAFGPPVSNAITLAVEQINSAGGIGGAPISIKVRDTKSTPEGGLEAAVVLAQDPEVRAFVGALSSSVTEQVVTIAAGAGVPTISPASTSPTLTNFTDQGVFFRTVPSDALQGRVMAQYAIDSGYARAAVMYVDNAYGTNLTLVFETAFETLGGDVAIAMPHKEEESLPDYSRDLEKIASLKPSVDLIVLVTYQKQGVQIMQDQKLFDLPAEWLLADGLRTETLAAEAGIDTLAGIQGTAPAPPTGPAWEQFRKDYIERFGTEPGAFTSNAYDAIYLLALAAAQANSFDRANLIFELNRISRQPGMEILPSQIPTGLNGTEVDFTGSSGPVDWDENGDPTAALYEVYEFQPDGSISQVLTLVP